MTVKRALSLFLIITATTANLVSAQNFDKAKLDSVLDLVVANNKGTGSLAISNNGQTIYKRAYGYRTINGNQTVPADVHTRYRIGSISKMFTACMVFQLIEKGKLTPDTKLAKFYPKLPNADKITIGMMLQHRSGLFNFTNDPAYGTYMGAPHTHEQMLTIMAQQPSEFEPDTKASYSNTNFVLLGYIVEKLTGQTYAQALQTRVANKVGLKETSYGGKINTTLNEAASMVYADNKWNILPETDMSVPGGAGAVVSTPADLDKFVEALFAGKIISQANVSQMQAIRDGYGMGMFRYPAFDKIGYGHTGGIDAFSSQVIYFPVEKMSIAGISNTAGGGELQTVLLAAISAMFNKPFTIPNYKTLAITAEQLEKYPGVYSSASFPLKITILKTADGKLMGQATGQSAFTLEATRPNTLEFGAAGIVLEFNTEKKEMILKQRGGVFTLTKEQ